MTVERINSTKKTLKKPKPGRVEVELATELSEPATRLSDYVIWLYGSPGIGKTTLSSLLGKKSHHLMFEKGGKALRIFQKPIRVWPEFAAYLSAIENSDFDNVTVDVVELAYKMCFKYMCTKLQITHPHDEDDYGKSWGMINGEFLEQMGRAGGMPDKGCVLISHAAMTERLTRSGEKIKDIHPALTGKILEAMEGAVDVLGYMFMDGTQHMMQIRGTASVMAKCRLEENFLHTDGSPVQYIPLGNSKEESRDAVFAAFNNELPPPERRAPLKKKKFVVKKK